MNIEQERFEAWLFAQPRREINPSDHQNCILCSFLKETAQCDNPSFTWDRWTEKCEMPISPIPVGNYPNLIPEWATRLVDPYMMSRLKTQNIADFLNRTIGLGHDYSGLFSSFITGVTCGQMQGRYIKLFGDPRKNIPSELAPSVHGNIELVSS